MTNGLITPDYKPHETLREQVERFLSSCGYSVCPWGYESLLPDSAKRLLQTKWNPTAMHLRGNADRLAIHQTEDIVFQVEFKTHDCTKLNDMLLEALPLLYHFRASVLGDKCLYCYWNPNTELHAGFWAAVPPKIDCIMIPGVFTSQEPTWMEKIFEIYGWKAKRKRVGPVNGSGDPYVKVAEEDAENLPSWKELILALGPKPMAEVKEGLNPDEIEEYARHSHSEF